MLGFLKWLGALALLLAILLGFPALLIAAVGNPWPDGGLNELSLMSNSAVLGLVSLLGWFVWAQFVLCTLWEIPPALRRDPNGAATRVPIATGSQQRFIRLLVHTVLAVGVSSTALLGSHAATATAAPPTPLAPVAQVTNHEPSADQISPAPAPVEAATDATDSAGTPRVVSAQIHR